MGRRLGYLNETEKEVVASFVKELKERLGEEILSIRLFGSRVRGDFSSDSDIDIFVLVKEKTPDVGERLDEITADYIFDYDLPLSPVLYDLFEYQKNKELGSFFFENVEKEGVLL